MANEVARFVVSIPISDLADLALNEGLGEAPSPQALANLVKEALTTGLEDLIGEVGNIDVRPTA